MKRTSFDCKRPLMMGALFSLTGVILSACGGGGDSGPSTMANPFAGRYVGSFVEGDGTSGEKGTFQFTIAKDGSATGVIVTRLSPDTIGAFGTVDDKGNLPSLAGNVSVGGTTYKLSGRLINANGAKTASGTWTSIGGVVGNRSGAWNAALAPATCPNTGNYTCRIGDLGRADFTILNDCTVVGNVSNARDHRNPHYGIYDPISGLLIWNDPWVAEEQEQSTVSLVLDGVITDVNEFADMSFRTVNTTSGQVQNQGTTTVRHDTSITKELPTIASASGMLVVRPGSTIVSSGLGAGDLDDGGYIQSYITFDASGIPSGAIIESAYWEVKQMSTVGNPFSIGPCLYAEPVSFTSQPPVGSGPVDLKSKVVTKSLANGLRTVDVASLLQQRANASRLQMRLRFPNNTNGDAQDDKVILSSGKLIVKYR